MTLTLLLLAAVVVGSNAFGFGGNRAHLNQNATFTCVKSGDWCSLLFFLETADNLDLIYLEDPDETNTITAGTYDSNGNGIDGNGTAALPYFVNVTMDCSSYPITLHSPTGIPVKVMAPDVFQIKVMAKAKYQAPFFGDVVTIDDTRYSPMCNCSEAEFSPVTENIIVSGDIEEDAVAITESAELKVYWVDVPFLSPGTITALGADTYYILVLNPDNTATGAFVFNCYICDVGACNGSQTYNIIGEDGCSKVAGLSGFYMQGGELRTDIFQAFRLSNQPNLFLSCSVGYCYDSADPRCDNYCASNTGRRKKRQADQSSDENIENINAGFTITVTNNRPGNPSEVILQREIATQKPVSECNLQYVGLMAGVITLSGILLVGLIVVILVFLHMSKRSSGTAGKA